MEKLAQSTDSFIGYVNFQVIIYAHWGNINKLNVLSIVAQPGLDVTNQFKALNGILTIIITIYKRFLIELRIGIVAIIY